MRTSFALVLAALVAVGSTGCASRPLRNIFHRGAPCGASVAPTVIGDVTTTYSPTCGMADCVNCGTASGMPVMLDESLPPGETIYPGPTP